jgi:hypothetical protein
MALKLKPPTHRADALGVFVSVHDPAWNDAVYTADLEALLAAALAEKQSAAEAEHIAKHPGATADEIIALRAACELSAVEQHRAKGLHPVVRYVTGKTRYQLGATDHAPDGSPCTVRERYLTQGAACEFTLRRLPFAAYQAADEITSTSERLTAFVRASLRAVKSPDYNWTAGDAETRAPDAVLQVLHEADPALLLEIGQAVIALCRPLDEAETPR